MAFYSPNELYISICDFHPNMTTRGLLHEMQMLGDDVIYSLFVPFTEMFKDKSTVIPTEVQNLTSIAPNAKFTQGFNESESKMNGTFQKIIIIIRGTGYSLVCKKIEGEDKNLCESADIKECLFFMMV